MKRQIKPSLIYFQRYLQFALRGKEALGRFGQADELYLHRWSRLCMNYASPSGTDESAWDKQLWNLRPSPMVRDWQVSCKTGNFLGFTDILIISYLTWSFDHTRTDNFFGLRPNVTGCFQRWCLQHDKVKYTLHIAFHWSLEKKIKDINGHGSFVVLTLDEVNLDWLVHTTPYLAIIFKKLSICTHSMNHNASRLRLGKESTEVLDITLPWHYMTLHCLGNPIAIVTPWKTIVSSALIPQTVKPDTL